MAFKVTKLFRKTDESLRNISLNTMYWSLRNLLPSRLNRNLKDIDHTHYFTRLFAFDVKPLKELGLIKEMFSWSDFSVNFLNYVIVMHLVNKMY